MVSRSKERAADEIHFLCVTSCVPRVTKNDSRHQPSISSKPALVTNNQPVASVQPTSHPYSLVNASNKLSFRSTRMEPDLTYFISCYSDSVKKKSTRERWRAHWTARCDLTWSATKSDGEHSAPEQIAMERGAR